MANGKWKAGAKSVSPKTARRYLRTVSDESSHFRAHNGAVLRNLWDLYAYLKNCDEESFRHHVDGAKNDFAAWVREVITDEDFADFLEYCIARRAMANRLLGRINYLVSASTQRVAGPRKAEMILEPGRTHEELFITADGRVIRDLWEMLDFVKSSKQEAFAHHVNELRNDIANWVEDMVLDTELSEQLKKAKTKEETHAIISKRLKELEKLASAPKPKGDVYHLHLASKIRPI